MSDYKKPSLSDAREQVVVISSKNKITQSSDDQYVVRIVPQLQQVEKLELLSFVGECAPYNIPDDITVAITVTQRFVGSYLVVTAFIMIRQGSYSIFSLLEMLNNQDLCRFQLHDNSRKVTVERTNWVGDLEMSNLIENNHLMNTLIGFPDGWIMTEDINGVETTFPVSTDPVTQGLLIIFDNVQASVASSNAKSGTFTVPLDHTTFDPVKKTITFNRETNFEQYVLVNNLNLSEVGIRIADALTGSPFKHMLSHEMVIKITHMRSSVADHPGPLESGPGSLAYSSMPKGMHAI
jgi:hypothetical protein